MLITHLPTQHENVHNESGDLLGYHCDSGGGSLFRVLLVEGTGADKGNESTAVRGEWIKQNIHSLVHLANIS